MPTISSPADLFGRFSVAGNAGGPQDERVCCRTRHAGGLTMGSEPDDSALDASPQAEPVGFRRVAEEPLSPLSPSGLDTGCSATKKDPRRKRVCNTLNPPLRYATQSRN
ncbi:hypothetical protein GCM10027262_40910 [Nocardia tengchongensis]